MLLVAYDTEYPQPLHAKRPIPDAFGVALVLTPENREPRWRDRRGAHRLELRSTDGSGAWRHCGPRYPRRARCRCCGCWHSAAAAARFSSISTYRALQCRSNHAPETAAGSNAHIPHHGRMCLLDEVIEWDAQHIRCRSGTHRCADNPLRSHGRLGVCVRHRICRAGHGRCTARSRGRCGAGRGRIELRSRPKRLSRRSAGCAAARVAARRHAKPISTARPRCLPETAQRAV